MTPSPLPPGVPGDVTPVRQVLLPDRRRFRLADPAVYTWRHESDVHRLTVPDGFEHDFASVPRLLWALVAPLDLGLASIFHDWLYVSGGAVETETWADGAWRSAKRDWTRRDADRLFARLMREQGVDAWKRRAAFLVVRLVAGRFWGRACRAVPRSDRRA